MKLAPENTIEFLNRFIGDRLEAILIGAVCSIERFDREKCVADVQPLILQTLPDNSVKDLPLLCNIRCGLIGCGDYLIRPDYKKNDLVWVTFATYDIYAGLKGAKADAEGGLFAWQNACVVCSMPRTGALLPESLSDKEGLLIAHVGGGAIEQVLSDKIVFHFGDEKTTLSAAGIASTGEIIADKEVTANAASIAIGLASHGHQTVTGPTLSKIPGGEA